MHVSVVVPTFNEAANVPELVRGLERVLAGVSWEVIFVDDDSPDRTAEVAKYLSVVDPRVRCIHRVGRRGLAGACIEGAMSSAADYLVFMDGDLQHDETIIPAMLQRLQQYADLVIGTRSTEQSDQVFSPFRAVSSKFGGLLATHLVHVPVRDPMSGFFAIRRQLFADIAPSLSVTGFKILLDILTIPDTGFVVEEIDYNFRIRHAGNSKFDARAILDYLGLLGHKMSGGLLPHRFVLFALVGLIGVFVHMSILRLLILMQPGNFIKDQLFATAVAMTANYFLNNLATYRDLVLKGWNAIRGLFWFYVICSIGTLANVGVADYVLDITSRWWIAGGAGIAIGSIFNFVLSDRFVWAVQPRRPLRASRHSTVVS